MKIIQLKLTNCNQHKIKQKDSVQITHNTTEISEQGANVPLAYTHLILAFTLLSYLKFKRLTHILLSK